jgi:hypothetical protein
MITDRLISYLVGIGVLARPNQLDQYPPLGRLIQMWKTHCPSPIVTSHVTDLQTAVDSWRQTRNKIVHSMVKSHPGEATNGVDDFLSAAKTAAAEGVILARALTDWTRKSRRAIEREKISAGTSSCRNVTPSDPACRAQPVSFTDCQSAVPRQAAENRCRLVAETELFRYALLTVTRRLKIDPTVYWTRIAVSHARAYVSIVHRQYPPANCRLFAIYRYHCGNSCVVHARCRINLGMGNFSAC